jgi:hypothetical protein
LRARFAVGDVIGGEGIFSAFVTVNGDVNITGQYRKNSICVAGCSAATKLRAGRAVTTYVPTASQPTVEDFGEATLQNGSAYVRLDAAFANVIDQRSSYFVYVTPEADSNGLYVAQKTPNGFAVRENRGGRSTLAFEYRIVAKPFGTTAPRLPMVTVPARHNISSTVHS